MRLCCFALVVSLLGAVGVHAEAPKTPLSWIEHRTDLAPPTARLSVDEASVLSSVGRSVGARQGYYFNGCESRAHTAWSMLPPSTRERVGKVWVFTPQLMEVLSPLRAEPMKTSLDPRVDWTYHVALTFVSYTGEELVIDLASSEQPQPLSTWLKGFSIPRGSWAIRTAGSWYSFNKTPQGVVSDFWKYNGVACEQAWLTKTVAFEAVGRVLAQGSDGCPTFSARFLKDAAGGYRALEAADFATTYAGERCAALKQTYEAERARLQRSLPGWLDPARGASCGVPDDGGKP
jgi:hypothetical protein